jgi:hypothetical protein
MFGGLVRYEWLLFEFAVVGWAGWELWTLRRDKRRPERDKAAQTKPGDAAWRAGGFCGKLFMIHGLTG